MYVLSDNASNLLRLVLWPMLQNNANCAVGWTAGSMELAGWQSSDPSNSPNFPPCEGIFLSVTLFTLTSGLLKPWGICTARTTESSWWISLPHCGPGNALVLNLHNCCLYGHSTFSVACTIYLTPAFYWGEVYWGCVLKALQGLLFHSLTPFAFPLRSWDLLSFTLCSMHTPLLPFAFRTISTLPFHSPIG